MNIRNILNSGDVVRFHNHSGIDKQRNSEHQWGVALILQDIYPNCSKSLLLAALTHDCAEYFTGDIPFPTKKASPELNSLLIRMENEWNEQNGIDFDLSWDEHIALKCADTLEGMQYCIKQVKEGKINAKRPFRKWRFFLTGLIAETSKSKELVSLMGNTSRFLNKLTVEMEEL